MKTAVLLCSSVLVLGGCATMATGPTATATLAPISGSTASGTVTFTEIDLGAVRVDVALTGVPPGVHGFHIHEKGDCGDNGNAAGGHYNPMGAPHAGPDAAAQHAGDLGNVTANAAGEVRTSFVTRTITVSDGPVTAVGHAVILHANPDDLTTQPTGNAGGRIACGVVQRR